MSTDLRRLDADVHRLVMGVQPREVRARGSTATVTVYSDYPTDGVYDERELRVGFACPPFSTDISAAWAVVERMARLGWRVKVHWESDADGRGFSECSLSHPVRGGFILKMRDTAPEAVCRAALVAVTPAPIPPVEHDLGDPVG